MPLKSFVFMLAMHLCDGLYSNLRITKFEPCNPGYDYPLTVTAKFRTIKNNHYMDFNGTYRIPFAYNASVVAPIAISANGKDFVHMMTIKDDDVCKFNKKYLGELYYKILEKSGLKRSQCPVPKGVYIGRNMKVDFGLIPVQALPTGMIRVRQVVTSNINKKTLSCTDMDISNKV